MRHLELRAALVAFAATSLSIACGDGELDVFTNPALQGGNTGSTNGGRTGVTNTDRSADVRDKNAFKLPLEPGSTLPGVEVRAESQEIEVHAESQEVAPQQQNLDLKRVAVLKSVDEVEVREPLGRPWTEVSANFVWAS